MVSQFSDYINHLNMKTMQTLMENKFQFMKYVFHILCFILTTFCVYRCFYHWCQDLDISLVAHQQYGEKPNYIKPAVSMCFFEPFVSAAFENNELGVNLSDYKKLLAGNLDDRELTPELLDIDFEKVTMNIMDYMIGYAIHWENDTFRFHVKTSLPPGVEMPHVSYIGLYYNWILKCYSLRLPLNASVFEIGFVHNIFPNNTLPSTYGFGVSFHYPNQFLKSYDNMRMTWVGQTNAYQKHKGMTLKINDFEVTIRRNTNKNKCNNDWLNDDQLVYETFLSQGKKCRPPYQIWNATYPICDTAEKISKANFRFGRQRDKFEQPCQTAEKIVFEYQEMDLTHVSTNTEYFRETGLDDYNNFLENGSFIISIQTLSNRFKVIQHVQKYDLQSLIGNSGGYIGLFLGKLNCNQFLRLIKVC